MAPEYIFLLSQQALYRKCTFQHSISEQKGLLTIFEISAVCFSCFQGLNRGFFGIRISLWSACRESTLFECVRLPVQRPSYAGHSPLQSGTVHQEVSRNTPDARDLSFFLAADAVKCQYCEHSHRNSHENQGRNSQDQKLSLWLCTWGETGP